MYIDSHTLGEPTRLVLQPPEELRALTVKAGARALASELFPIARRVVGEPRTSDAAVGAFLLPPQDSSHDHAVLFFNDVGPLAMCVHGLIGLMASLRHLGNHAKETLRFETPAGTVHASSHADGSITVENVHSYCSASRVPIITSSGPLLGEIAWGGNWFFHLESPLPIEWEDRQSLLDLTVEIRVALEEGGLTGDDGAPIDHVGLFEKMERTESGLATKNFVLCPGGAFDRSPCGTGSSAWLAARYAAGELEPGEVVSIGSMIGSRFDGSFRLDEAGAVIPRIRGAAHVVAEGKLVAEPDDPYLGGLPK